VSLELYLLEKTGWGYHLHMTHRSLLLRCRGGAK